VFRGLAIVIALLLLGVVIGTDFWLFAFTILGAFLWIGATGKWPGSRRRVNPVLRAVVGLMAVAGNAFIGLIGAIASFASAVYGDGGEFFILIIPGVFVGVFVGVSALEALVIQLLVWGDKIVRYLWRGGTSYEPFREGNINGLPELPATERRV
jgi:hypothetical protein